nr:MLP-like protein 43 [Ipomoea batatas]GMD82152.1 MLP-like protein 43 [Ipomoea batatas]
MSPLSRALGPSPLIATTTTQISSSVIMKSLKAAITTARLRHFLVRQLAARLHHPLVRRLAAPSSNLLLSAFAASPNALIACVRYTFVKGDLELLMPPSFSGVIQNNTSKIQGPCPVFCLINNILCEERERSKGRDPVWVVTKKSLGRKKAFWRKIMCGSNKLRSVILLNVITVVYASNICVVKEVETLMDPAAFSAMRFLICAIPFLPFVFQARNDVETRNAGMELGLWISLGYLIEALGLLTCDAGRASFISLFTVIMVPLFESLLGAIIPARTWFGVFMSVVGIAMLECSGSPPNVCVIAVMSVIWYAVGGNFDGFQECDIGGGWSWSMFCEWMVAFPWIPTLYTGVFSTGLCLWAEIAAMRDVSATETAVIYGLEPLWGAAFAWFLLGERWGLAGWIGAALVLGR